MLLLLLLLDLLLALLQFLQQLLRSLDSGLHLAVGRDIHLRSLLLLVVHGLIGNLLVFRIAVIDKIVGA